MKRIMLVVIALLLLVPAGLSLGCDEKAEVTWRLTTTTKDGDTRTEVYEEFARLVNEKTDGEMEITIFPGGELYSGNEVFDAVSEGSVQMGACTASSYFGKMTKTAMCFSYVWTRDSWEFAQVHKAFTEQMESVKNEAIENDIMHTLWQPGGFVEFYFDRSVEEMSDVDGLKLRSFGGIGGPIIENLGGAAVTMDFSDLYLAAQKGTVDGAGLGFEIYVSSRIYEVLPYAVLTRTMPAVYSTLINRSAFEDLPQEYQTAIQEAVEEVEEQGFTDYTAVDEDKIQELVDNPDVDVYYLSDDEQENWFDNAIIPVLDGMLTKYLSADEITEATSIANNVITNS